MNATIQSRFVIISIIVAVCAALYLASAGQTEAKERGVMVRQKSELSSRASSTRPVIDFSCMSQAVDTRESALVTAWGEFDEAVEAALAKRKTALIAAWDIDDNADRSKSLRAAWDAWKTDKKAAHGDFRADRKSAWETFKKTAKDSCKMTLPKEEGLEKTTSDSVSI